jgi:hypothetical protein
MTNESKFDNMTAGGFEQILHEWEDRMRAAWQDRQPLPTANPLVEEWRYADSEVREQQRREQEGFESVRPSTVRALKERPQ